MLSDAGGASPGDAALSVPSTVLPDATPAGRAQRLARATVTRKMTVDVTVIREVAALRAIADEWRALANAGGPGALFRGPDWLVPWWHAYHRVLGAELHVLLGREDGELVCLAPFYVRTAKVALVSARELRMLGDAGPRPPAFDILCKPGAEERAGAVLARALIESAADWDVIDLAPLADPSKVRANLVSRLSAAGMAVESAVAAGGARRIALGHGRLDQTQTGLIQTLGDDVGQVRKGLSALRRLSRLEWAERDENSPLADAEGTALLEEVALTLGQDGRARLARIDDSSGEAAAAALVLDDGDRAVVLAMAVDPEWVPKGAAAKLLGHEAEAAAARGRVGLDVVTGANEYTLPALPVSKQTAVAVKVWALTRNASVSRTARSVARSAKAAREVPGTAAAQARAAWTKIKNAAAEVAQYQRMHLYRGQLWTRGIEAPPGLEVARFDAAAYDALGAAGIADLAEHLELDEATARMHWKRGDVAMLARLGGRPAGIAWAARGPVEVPELARTLRLTKYEAYVHDVFVAPTARGRSVGPVMLEQLAGVLRERDAFRAWALIGSDNPASVRAFQKASFTPVCDVIRARMVNVDRLIVRPPDPEARELLGL